MILLLFLLCTRVFHSFINIQLITLISNASNYKSLTIQYSRNFKLVFLSIFLKTNNLRTSNSTLTRILFGDWILSTENCIYRYPQAGILIFGFIEFNDLFYSVVISKNQPKYNVLTYLLHMYLVVNDANTVIILCFISLNYVNRWWFNKRHLQNILVFIFIAFFSVQFNTYC